MATVDSQGFAWLSCLVVGRTKASAMSWPTCRRGAWSIRRPRGPPRGGDFLQHEQGCRLGQGLVLTPDLLLQLLDALLIHPPLGALGLAIDRGIGLDVGRPPDRDLLGVEPLRCLPQTQVMPPTFTQKIPLGGDFYPDTGGGARFS
jgi:hypothetical protein